MSGLNKKIKWNRGMIRSIFTQGHAEYSRGMTYVELIVVLSIFAIMTSVVLFNYGKFQEKVDIKNLANDIALKLVEAQRFSASGQLPPSTQQPTVSPWKPSYGLYFQASTNNSFVYFADLDQDKNYNTSASCPLGECLAQININKNNTISAITVTYTNGIEQPLNDVTIFFTRPSQIPTFKSVTTLLPYNISYVKIAITSPHVVNALIKIYASGRIQIN